MPSFPSFRFFTEIVKGLFIWKLSYLCFLLLNFSFFFLRKPISPQKSEQRISLQCGWKWFSNSPEWHVSKFSKILHALVTQQNWGFLATCVFSHIAYHLIFFPLNQQAEFNASSAILSSDQKFALLQYDYAKVPVSIYSPSHLLRTISTLFGLLLDRLAALGGGGQVHSILLSHISLSCTPNLTQCSTPMPHSYGFCRSGICLTCLFFSLVES